MNIGFIKRNVLKATIYSSRFRKEHFMEGNKYVDVENYVIPKNIVAVTAVTIAVFMFCL